MIKMRSVFVAVGLGVMAGVCQATQEVPRLYGDIGRRVAQILPTQHLSREPFDDSLSAKAWTNLLNAVDPTHSLFTQEDIARYEQQRLQLDDQIKSRNITFGYEVIDLAKERIVERYTFVTNALEGQFDFTVNETYQWRRKDAPWPTDAAAQKKVWFSALKNELLALMLTRELDAEEAEAKAAKKAEALAKAQAEAAEKAKTGSSEAESELAKVETEEKDSEEESELKDEEAQEPIGVVIRKRYRSAVDSFVEMDNETILQIYLSAVSNAYDPHTDYMSPMTMEDFNMDMNLVLCGIGATLRYDEGMIKIMEIMPGSPAERDKRDIRLVEGDRIIGVAQDKGEMEDIRHKPMNRTIRKIRGPKGTRVVLKVIPASDKSGATTKLVDLVRDEIKLEEQAVTGRVERITLPGGEVRKLGYARIPAFYNSMGVSPYSPNYRSVTADLVKYIQKFNTERVDGLILDLRNNGGGSLQEAIMMTSLFTSGPVVQVKKRNQVDTLETPRIDSATAFRKPMLVLINKTSASASEIVAGALKDYGRAILVGDPTTHGKGTVQTVLPIQSELFGIGNADRYGSEKVTTAAFYRINGASTQLKGVEADIVLPSIFSALEIGEDKLPGALPWTQVSPAYYTLLSDTTQYIKTLTEKSQARLATNAPYQHNQKLIQHVKELNSIKDVTLERKARRELMVTERQLQDFEEEAMAPTRSKQKEKEDKDFVLKESFNILSDYIDLRGGPDVPFETNGRVASGFKWLL